jgi:hypothetical protein
MLSDLKEKFRNQKVEITLFLPLNTFFKIDKSAARYDCTDADYFLWKPELTHAIYKVVPTEIKCVNCADEDDEWNEDENNNTNTQTDSIVTTTISVNGEVVSIKQQSTNKGLSVNKNGVIIKNK